MPYRLRANEALQNGIRRITSDQIDQMLGVLKDSAVSQAVAIHEVRKRCKKIRSVLRLVRPALENCYKKENAWYRDAARLLSAVRDAGVMLETCDRVLNGRKGQITDQVAASIRERLRHRGKALTADNAAIGVLLEAFKKEIVGGRERVASWTLDEDGFSAVSGGFRKIYSQACEAMAVTCEEPSPEHFHNWRKRVKYHGHHLSLLRDLWPTVMQARQEEVEVLGGLLGDHHNLYVLRGLLLSAPDFSGMQKEVSAFTGLIDSQLGEIESECRALGKRLFGETPKRFTERIGGYW